MKNSPCLLFLLMLFGSPLYAQVKESISKPELILRDSLLHIGYHIEHSDAGTRYTIRLEITGQDGKPIDAQHLWGDVGAGVIGGSSRQITWDYGKDLPGMTEGLDVGVRVWATREETARVYGTAALMLRSMAFPGWGLQTIDGGKPYWIMGVAGYGAVLASVSLNRLSESNYRLYLDEASADQRDHYYALQEKQLRGSRLCAAAAAGIWASSLAWTGLRGRKYQQRANFDASLRFRPDPSNTALIPELSLVYRF